MTPPCDVSRWGRFQDADEGAYHEHVCSRAGIRVHYCGEQFDNDGSIGSILLKNVKRVMAGEYSLAGREHGRTIPLAEVAQSAGSRAASYSRNVKHAMF